MTRKNELICDEAALELFRRRVRDDESLAFFYAGRCIRCGSEIPKTKAWCGEGCAAVERTPVVAP